MTTPPSATVVFNIGGTHYEVSKSLLSQHPDTMLARLASDEWQEGKVDYQPMFVERDAERFKFVLDFMRDGQVSIPATSSITKQSLLKEFEYYGVAGAPTDLAAAVHVEFSTREACKEVARALKMRKEDTSQEQLRRECDKKIVVGIIFQAWVKSEMQKGFCIRAVAYSGIEKDAIENVIRVRVQDSTASGNQYLEEIVASANLSYGIEIKRFQVKNGTHDQYLLSVEF